MKDNIGRKGLVLGIILLFVGAGVIPSTVSVIEEKIAFTSSISPGYIQGLIDNASDGDTIYIPNGTYYENIIINKTISLIGEDENTTIIDSGGTVGDVVYISADWVNISGFTIRNGLNGIEIESNYSTIHNNMIFNNYCGIYLVGTSYNNIKENSITSNKGNGISVVNSYYNTIKGNTITSNTDNGISLRLSDYNTIIGNTISNENNGVYVGGSNENNISGNIISDNKYGVLIRFLIIWQHAFLSRNNTITKNNFLGNRPHAYCGGDWSNKWIGNYWNRPRTLPKLIFGLIFIGFYGFVGIVIAIPWISFDTKPAKELYEIGV
ncbi:MAG: right-handed parallel beta-helix repeat-containing protein [Thermoplasmatales archaeon]|nr:MAG: right-handed parallel beta-helix repeat-containing protein [Thermoplasmatales archaeon]